MAVCVVFVVLAVWILVRTGWLFLVGPQVSPARVLPVPAVSRAAGISRDADWNLFGTHTPLPVQVRAAPASALNLHLRGVVAGASGGYAVIAGPDGSEEVYRVGDSLPGRADVEAIEARRVLLRRDGRIEALELPSQLHADTPGSSEADATTSRSAPAPTPFAPEATSGMTAASIPGIAGMTGIDPAALHGRINVMPVASGGWRVRPGRDATLFTGLGLVANDIITAVNGKPLESRADVEALVTDIGTSGELSITVLRDDRELVLRPDLGRLSGTGRP